MADLPAGFVILILVLQIVVLVALILVAIRLVKVIKSQNNGRILPQDFRKNMRKARKRPPGR